MFNIELLGKRKRERPQGKFLDVVKEDMQRFGVTEKNARDRVRWRQI